MKIAVQEVTDLNLAFGGDMKKLLPPYNEIPQEFRSERSKWNKVVSDWFYYGLKNAEWNPKEGVETQKALRHVKAIMGSWEPKHEHKEAGCAYLLSEFFHDVKYERAK
ncbi:hypothetical protein [Paenibacillus ginsengarvi]|uniref:Uncharacterized protein n=1 Tax=Paenibacillus ginsengarvi TaxID=400777 RepID=A0A3B0BNQ6_9BACL|nr:hypothetical protein [Paenibacillus ginsengarvi]RKN75023.1 hypothetical protein D7M11_26165 [Paenibacillus ginsengarvi]